MLGSAVVCMALAAGAAQAQQLRVYQCKTAKGEVVFSDRVCTGPASVKEVKLADEPADMAQRKAQSDARISRDKTLAGQVESSRLAREQAARSAQDQQVQASRAASERVDQERARQNAATVSDPSVTQSAPTLTVP